MISLSSVLGAARIILRKRSGRPRCGTCRGRPPVEDAEVELRHSIDSDNATLVLCLRCHGAVEYREVEIRRQWDGFVWEKEIYRAFGEMCRLAFRKNWARCTLVREGDKHSFRIE